MAGISSGPTSSSCTTHLVVGLCHTGEAWLALAGHMAAMNSGLQSSQGKQGTYLRSGQMGAGQ